jgi:signal transduction histidine kinase/ligand-binding sensor domain-containing protein
MKKQIYFLILIFYSCLSNSLAQQLYFNHLSVNNGLSQGVNNCIFKDSQGFVWISSYDGLNRFDGMSCISYRSSVNEAIGLKGTLFLNILEDQNSNLWIGSNAGLNFYNRQLNVFQNFRIGDRHQEDQFYSPFYIDDKNNIWLQSVSDIIVFNSDTKSFKLIKHFPSPGNLIINTFPKEPFRSLRQIFAIKNNKEMFWLADLSGEEVQWHSIQFPFPSTHITSLLPTSGKRFWMGTDRGASYFELNRKLDRMRQVVNMNIKNVTALHLDPNGTLWVGTLQQGLLSVDTLARKIKNQYVNSSYSSYTLAGNQVRYITSDNKGELWVSIWGKGVDYTSLDMFRFNHHVTKEEAVLAGTDNFIRSIIQVDNEFWCGTQSSGILILDKEKKIKQSIQTGIPASIEYLFLDKNKLIWACTFEGLFIIDPKSKKIIKLPENDSGKDLASNQYNFISSLPNGSMIVSSNAGLFLVDIKDGKYHFSTVKGIENTDNVFLTTYIDKLNHIYVSQAFKGFSVYNLSGDSLKPITDFPFEATIKCFSESNDSILWIGSTIGLIKFNKFDLQFQKLYTTSQGLSNQYIYGIIPDNNYLWVSTNSGINRVDLLNKKIKIFSAGDGLQSNEFNTYSFCKSEDGEILFGGVNGINSFFPADFRGNTYPPQIILTGIQINDSTFFSDINPSVLKNLNLKYQQNTVKFQFTVIQYSNSAANTLNYMLKGYDKSWVSATNKTQIRYSNLPPGQYTLIVKAYNADGIEAENTYSLPITVKAPWWRSIWFECLTAFLVLGIVHFISRSYLNRRLEKQKVQLEKKQAIEKERTRISHDMHDDLGSGLTMIAILSEVAKKQLTEPEKAKELLEKIAVASRDLVDSLQDIIWLLNPKNDTIESLSAYIREYGLKYFEPLSVKLEFIYPEQFSKNRLGDEQRRNIFLSVKESFNNIAKHAEPNKIIVSIQETSNEFRLIITDDGKGFDMNSVRIFANGLKNMQTRIEQSGGHYFITSQPEKGTQTEIKFQI